ncbi:MAG: hypothetical protein J5883_03645 [Clostridiales bacterium]|nr:hypothetical protein [Clostridiales bacterium]
MKRIRTFIATALVASMTLSMAGCSLMGSKIGPKKLQSYSDDFGAEIYDDSDDFMDDLDDAVEKNDPDELKDGIFTIVKDDDIKDAMKKSALSTYTDDFYEKTINELAIFVRGEQDGYDSLSVIALSAVYDSKKDAEEAFEDMVDTLEDATKNDYYDTDCDTFEDGGIQYVLFTLESSFFNQNVGIYQDGNTILFIIGTGNPKKDIENGVDDVCEFFGVVPPSDL